MEKGDFVKFKIGCICHYGIIDKIDGDFAEVSYNSKKAFMRAKERFGLISVPHFLLYVGDVRIEELIKLDYPRWVSLI